MNDLIRLLDNISYKELGRICGEEELPKSGKKIDLIKRLVENLPEEKLRAHLIEFMGVGAKIQEHILVPTHRLMEDKEVQKLIAGLGIKKWQLPKLLDKDPIAILLGARPGRVLEIKRRSETAGESTYYRLVIRSGV